MIGARFCAVALITGLALACGAGEGETPHAEAPRRASLDHIPRVPPGGSWIALSPLHADFVREFEKTGAVYYVGVPLAKLVGRAYGVHPSRVAVADENRKARFDAVVRPAEGGSERAVVMLRELLRRELGIEAVRQRRPVMSMVLMPAPTGVLLQPADTRDEILELERGRLRAQGAQISQLVALLMQDALRPVVDETGLDAHYDFVIEWDPSKGAYAFIQALDDIGLQLTAGVRDVEQMVVVEAGRVRSNGT